jgi:hypothetical protein
VNSSLSLRLTCLGTSGEFAKAEHEADLRSTRIPRSDLWPIRIDESSLFQSFHVWLSTRRQIAAASYHRPCFACWVQGRGDADACRSAAIGGAGSVGNNQLVADLEIEARLDAMRDKLLKSLLFVRGVKSLASAPSTSAPSTQKLLRSTERLI